MASSSLARLINSAFKARIIRKLCSKAARIFVENIKVIWVSHANEMLKHVLLPKIVAKA